MANLKSYSCPTCGSFLEVDRDQDVFDCPFCGSHFDAVSFHGTDLYEQARLCLKDKDYKQAREKYAFLLKHKPDDFELLYGYACAVGEVSSLDKFSDPAKYSSKLLLLFTNDESYTKGPAAPYFAKLAELFTISSNYNEMKSRQQKLLRESEAGLKSLEEEKSSDGCGSVFYVLAHYIFGAMLIGALDIWSNVVVCTIYLFMPMVVLFVISVKNFSKEGKAELSKQERRKPFHDMRTEAESFTPKLEELKEAHKQAYKDIPELKRQAGTYEPSPVKAKGTGKNSFPAVISKTQDDKGTDDVPETIFCINCGATLALDNERKLFVCEHCGVSYDYALFIGEPMTKANTDLRNREFDLADKRFAKILESAPSDFEAHRGRILCACKWIGFTEAKLDHGFSDVDWEALDKAITEAIDHSVTQNKLYFTELKKLLETARSYGEVCNKLKDDSLPTQDLKEYSDSKESLIQKYNEIYHRFADRDRKFRTVISYSSNENPKTMVDFRNRIMGNGNWLSILKIKPYGLVGDSHYMVVRSDIEEAIANSNGQYRDYFKLWKEFLDILIPYSKFLISFKRLKKIDEENRAKDISYKYSIKGEELESQIKLYSHKGEELKKKMDEKHKELIRLDKELFPECSDDEGTVIG